jgi:hypothetical protein
MVDKCIVGIELVSKVTFASPEFPREKYGGGKICPSYPSEEYIVRD